MSYTIRMLDTDISELSYNVNDILLSIAHCYLQHEYSYIRILV